VNPFVARIQRQRWLVPLVALAVVTIVFSIAAPSTFPRFETLATMLRQTVVVGILAVGMTFVVLTGGIDLSVGSAVAFTTVVIALALRGHVGAVPAAACGIFAATLAGAAQGTLVAKARIAPFIATLFGMTVLRGAAKGLAKEQKIDVDAAGIDALLAAGSLFAPGVWILLAIFLAAAVVLRRTRFGRHVIAVGSSEATSRLAGIDVGRVRILVYALSGCLAGIAGVMEFGTLTLGDPTDSVGLELSVIAAVVVGGTALSGGEGGVLGSLVGALLMTVIRTGANHTGIPNWVQEILTGFIIVGAAMGERRSGR
jgi:ribose transport system permease protein